MDTGPWPASWPHPRIAEWMRPLTSYALLWRLACVSTLWVAAVSLLPLSLCRLTPALRDAVAAWPAIALVLALGVAPLQLAWRAAADARAARVRELVLERHDAEYFLRSIGFVAHRLLRRHPAAGGLLLTAWTAALVTAAALLAARVPPALAGVASQCRPVAAAPAWVVWAGMLAVLLLCLRVLRDDARRLGAARRLLGTRGLARGIGLMCRLRSRQPARDLLRYMPLFNSGTLLGVLLALLAWPSAGSPVLQAALAATLAVVLFTATLWPLVPPTALLLGVTGDEPFGLMRTLAHGLPGLTVTLIDQADPRAAAAYAGDRERFLSGLPAPARVAAGAVPANPSGPRRDNIRTREAAWRDSVADAAGFVRWIVVDARAASEHVDAEIDWLLVQGLLGKTVFVVGDDGAQPALERLRARAGGHAQGLAQLVRADALDGWLASLRAGLR